MDVTSSNCKNFLDSLTAQGLEDLIELAEERINELESEGLWIDGIKIPTPKNLKAEKGKLTFNAIVKELVENVKAKRADFGNNCLGISPMSLQTIQALLNGRRTIIIKLAGNKQTETFEANVAVSQYYYSITDNPIVTFNIVEDKSVKVTTFSERATRLNNNFKKYKKMMHPRRKHSR